MFSSIDRLEFKLATPRDDLISLAYLLIFIVNGDTLPYYDEFMSKISLTSDDTIDKLDLMLKFKALYPLEMMALHTGHTEIIKFCREVAKIPKT
jgi:hypothetical protein